MNPLFCLLTMVKKRKLFIIHKSGGGGEGGSVSSIIVKSVGGGGEAEAIPAPLPPSPLPLKRIPLFFFKFRNPHLDFLKKTSAPQVPLAKRKTTGKQKLAAFEIILHKIMYTLFTYQKIKNVLVLIN